MKRIGLVLGVCLLLFLTANSPESPESSEPSPPSATSEPRTTQAPTERSRRPHVPRRVRTGRAIVEEVDEFEEELFRLHEDEDLELEDLDLEVDPGAIRQIDSNQFAIAPDVLAAWAAQRFVPPGATLGEFQTTEYGEGQVLDAVEPGSLAGRMGLLLGDVLVSFNGKPVGDPRFDRFTPSMLAQFDDVDLLVVRAGRSEPINYLVR